MIIADYQPLSIVENIGFLEYSKMLQPLYSPRVGNCLQQNYYRTSIMQ